MVDIILSPQLPFRMFGLSAGITIPLPLESRLIIDSSLTVQG